MAKNTKGEFEEYLNELGTPDDDLKSLGGRIPDNSKYGSWLRRNDVIAFQVGYNGWCLDASEDCSHNNLIRKVYAHVSNDGQSHTDDRYRKFNDFSNALKLFRYLTLSKYCLLDSLEFPKSSQHQFT